MYTRLAILLALPLAAVGTTVATAGNDTNGITAERGRYLIQIGGCNDCHTPHYPEAAGKVPEKDWLVGNTVGFRGPWGTTYPSNLRMVAQHLSEEQWVVHARSEMRPPMPWFALRDMTDDDLRAVYRYIHGLGPKGDIPPAYVPPGGVVKTPYIDFVPQNLPKQQVAR